ncbi:Spag6, partial [Symbiodinium sp. KB8]
DIDIYVRKNAATCIREVVKHTPELAKLVVNAGGGAALVDYVRESAGNVRLPGIMALGYISAFSETLALAVIVAKGVEVLKEALLKEPEDHLKAATVWTLGQVGRHTPDHAKALAEAGIMQPMVVLHVRPDSSPDLQLKAKRALKAVLAKCTDAHALAPLLRDANEKVQKYVLAQYAAILPHNVGARKAFMQTGLLQRVQDIKRTAGPKVQESIAKINACFPPEAVKFSDKEYASELLAKIDDEAM